VNVTRGNEDGKNASWGDISTVWVDARDGVGGSQHGSQQVATTNLYSLVVARRFASRRQSHPYLPRRVRLRGISIWAWASAALVDVSSTGT
jgi:hypothetical protein